MTRREALTAVSAIMGGTIIGANAFLSGCASAAASDYAGVLTNAELATLREVAETILPKTDLTPGATDCKVAEFMNVMVTECYDVAEQTTFKNGVVKLDELSNTTHQKSFVKLAPEQRHALFLQLEAEAKTYGETRKPEDPETHYYQMMKQLSLVGFLTSEVGMTKAMRHVAVPGRFDPCIEYTEGEKSFSG